MLNYKQLYKAFDDFKTDNFMGALFISIYQKIPLYYKFYFDESQEIQCISGAEEFYHIKNNIKHKIDSRQLLKDIIENKLDIGVEVLSYAQRDYLVIGTNVSFLMNITLSECDCDTLFEDMYCCEADVEAVLKLLRPYFTVSDRNEEISFGIAALDGGNNVYTSWYDYELKHDIDIDINYNDDFKDPYNKICNVVKDHSKSGLVLLYGEPGTGKSSVIKKLISEYPQTDFIFIDGTLLMSASQEKLMSYFLENQNTVFILEDCEKVLMSRDKGYNGVINTILNITDGIIGDVLGVKLICTFNTSLSNIDKALLRKGRLSVKYEFGKLDAKKTSDILGYEVKDGMTLADIYNIEEENDYSKDKRNKIGF